MYCPNCGHAVEPMTGGFGDFCHNCNWRGAKSSESPRRDTRNDPSPVKSTSKKSRYSDDEEDYPEHW
jgi:hypothetical protein